MKKKTWNFALALAVMLALPFLVGSAQDFEDPIEELIEEYVPIDDEDTLVSIVTTMIEYGSLETFLELTQAAGLIEELKGDGPLTVFVPDDSAFAQLQPAQLEKLLSDREQLKNLLSRHIVKGQRVEFGDVADSLTVKALNGDVINIEVSEESVRIEKAWVLDEQIECSNGIIHVIDAVLLAPKGPRKG